MSFARGSYVIWNGIVSEIIEETEREGTYTLQCTHPLTGEVVVEEAEESEFIYFSNARKELAVCTPKDNELNLYVACVYRPRGWVNQYKQDEYALKSLINPVAMPGQYELFITMASCESSARDNLRAITNLELEQIDHVSTGNSIPDIVKRVLQFNWGSMRKWEEAIAQLKRQHNPPKYSQQPILLSADQLFLSSLLVEAYLESIKSTDCDPTEYLEQDSSGEDDGED